MADLAQAISDLQAVDQRVVDELKKLADEVRNAPSTQEAADAIEAEVAKLQGGIDEAETPPEPTP